MPATKVAGIFFGASGMAHSAVTGAIRAHVVVETVTPG
jgi:hypothetical protein